MSGTSDPGRSRPRRVYSTTRMEAFSDGVIAIAITLLVLDLIAPPLSDGSVSRALVD